MAAAAAAGNGAFRGRKAPHQATREKTTADRNEGGQKREEQERGQQDVTLVHTMGKPVSGGGASRADWSAGGGVGEGGDRPALVTGLEDFHGSPR